MRAVKSWDTAPEKVVRCFLHRHGFRFSLKRNDLPGKPDIVLPSRRTVVFVHGCFWHGHDCKRGARTPVANRDYWLAKIARNTERDIANAAKLAELRWRVAIVWECQTRNADDLRRALAQVLKFKAMGRR